MKKDAPCILDQTNASRKTLDLIADKWTILVLFALRSGKRRFAELRREISGVTEKMLIQTLRNLERDGIVARKVYPTVPPKVEYSISELGWSLAPILDAIVDWSYGNLGKVFAARAAYEKKKVREKTASAKSTSDDVQLVSVAKPGGQGYLLRELDNSKKNSHFVARR